MPPKGSRKAPLSFAEAQLQGNSSLLSFFAKVPSAPRAGRPPGKQIQKKRGRPAGLPPAVKRTAAASTSAVQEEPDEGVEVETTESVGEGAEDACCDGAGAPLSDKKADGDAAGRKRKPVGQPRVNWSKGENLAKLTKAVDDWFAEDGKLSKEVTLHQYAKQLGIPKATLGKYVHPDPAKRQRLGAHAGQPSLVDASTQAFVVDVIRRRDRANDGMSRREIVGMIQDLKPKLSKQQVSDVFLKTIRPNNCSLLTNIVKAQATTTKRNQITVAQQYRWHHTVDKAFRMLRSLNTGTLRDGRTFAEVMEHFVAGGDETCFLASSGDVKIIGDKRKKKHELASANSRVSTTIYRVGFASGHTGPTAFLPPGVRRKTGYTDQFLVNHGAMPGEYS